MTIVEIFKFVLHCEVNRKNGLENLAASSVHFDHSHYANNYASSDNENSWHDQFYNPYGLISFGFSA